MRGRIAVVALALLAARAAQARDAQLVEDMVALERAYINPLFFTSNQNLPKTSQTFPAFAARWQAFAASYRDHRPSRSNWAVHFDTVDAAIASADAIIRAARAACPLPPPGLPVPPCPQLVPAHDALEAVRSAMLELRRHNGLPRFFTDRCTDYHGPMEEMVLSVKGLSADQVSDGLLAGLAAQVDEAELLWRRLEQTPLEPAWSFTPAQEAVVLNRIAQERAVLDAFAEAVRTGDRAAIPLLGLQLKQYFVAVYTSFAGDPALNRLP